MLQLPPETIVSVNLRLIKYIFPAKSQSNVFTGDNIAFFTRFKVYLAKIVNGHISHPSNPF